MLLRRSKDFEAQKDKKNTKTKKNKNEFDLSERYFSWC